MEKKITTTNLIMEGGVGTGLYISIDNIHSFFGPDNISFDELDMSKFLTSFFECQLKIFDGIDTSSLISDLLLGFSCYKIEAFYRLFTMNPGPEESIYYNIVRDQICCEYYDIIAKRLISNVTGRFITKGVMPNSNGSSNNSIDIVINNMKSILLHFRALYPILCFGEGDMKRTEFLISETGDDRYEIKISEYQIDTFISEFFRYFSLHSKGYMRILRMERRI